MNSIWVLGDALDRTAPLFDEADPSDTVVVMIEATEMMASRSFHRQRLHFVLASMRRFAEERRREGFRVDYRRASTFASGFGAHRAEYEPERIRVTEPTSWTMHRAVEGLDVEFTPSSLFLCHYDDFATWASGRKRLVMEDFYRWQRTRFGYLMDGDAPAGGQWNFDAANREPPDRSRTDWPSPIVSPLDDLDRGVVDSLPESSFGAVPDGTWATTRAEALHRLDTFVEQRLPEFGPAQDAMLSGRWSMLHSLISPYLNAGLLRPGEVCDAAEAAYRSGKVPIESAEGFIRQVLGWREYVWGIYWLLMPEYRESNHLDATRPLPPVFTGANTHMACVADVMSSVTDHAYAHHIQRLMVIANLGLIAGVVPAELTDWMRRAFIDGGDWVMVPNVVGMGLYADGGIMATKPYAAGGNYINRMSDYCRGCRYDPKQRTGPDACPFSTLYWDFLDRNQERLSQNHRLSRQLGGARRLANMDEVRERAGEVLDLLDRGEL